MLKIILFSLFYLVAIPAVFISPLIIRILIFGVNCIVPDPIPYVDEILMGAGVISKIRTAESVCSHPKRYLFLAAAALILIILLFALY